MGMGKSGSKRSTSQSALNLNGLSSTDAQQKIQAMQLAMGQTGDEAGETDPSGGSMFDRGKKKLYVKTSKAFNINAYLMSDGKTIHSDDSNWDNLGYTERMIKNDIAKIDSGMKPLSQNVQTYRYIDADGLSKMLGLSLNGNDTRQMINDIAMGNKKAMSDLSNALNTTYVHKGYTSLTYDINHPQFDTRDVRMDIKLTKGTQAIVTNNHVEHEILGAHGLTYNFNKKFHVETTKTGKKQLVIEVTI